MGPKQGELSARSVCCICYPRFVIAEEVNGIVRPLIKVEPVEQEVDLMSSSPLSSQGNMLAIPVLIPLCSNFF